MVTQHPWNGTMEVEKISFFQRVGHQRPIFSAIFYKFWQGVKLAKSTTFSTSENKTPSKIVGSLSSGNLILRNTWIETSVKFSKLSKHEIQYISNITTIRKSLASRILHRFAHEHPNRMHESIRPLLKSTSNVSWQTHVTLTDTRMLKAVYRPTYDPCPCHPHSLPAHPPCPSSSCPIYASVLLRMKIVGTTRLSRNIQPNFKINEGWLYAYYHGPLESLGTIYW